MGERGKGGRRPDGVGVGDMLVGAGRDIHRVEVAAVVGALGREVKAKLVVEDVEKFERLVEEVFPNAAKVGGWGDWGQVRVHVKRSDLPHVFDHICRKH